MNSSPSRSVNLNRDGLYGLLLLTSIRSTSPGTLPDTVTSTLSSGIGTRVPCVPGSATKLIVADVIADIWHSGFALAWNLNTFPSGKVIVTIFGFVGCRQ